MEIKDFDKWLSTFCKSIYGYDYYVDFDKVYANVDKIKVELNILNSLVGSQDIENEFENLITKYPETLKCIPILLAVRQKEVLVSEEGELFVFNFKKMNYSMEDYKKFMRKSGLFDLLSNHLINNLVDYVTGVEAGLSSNGRQNRGGDTMENLVESFLKKSGLKKNKDYFKEMYASKISEKWNIDLSSITNDGKSDKRFDFVVKMPNMVYAIETNFYSKGGSKLNETARSYKNIALESANIEGFSFIWVTDGVGWKTAKRNLRETIEAPCVVYNILDLKNGIFDDCFK